MSLLPIAARTALLLAATCWAVAPADAEQVVMARGVIEFTDPHWQCYGCGANQWQDKIACSDSTPPALGLTFGCTNGLEECHGDISGSYTQLGAEIDGIRVYNDTLPTVAYYTFGIWYDYKYGCNCCSSCTGWPHCQVEWSIGGQSGIGNDELVLYEFLASEVGEGLDFTFRFCGHAVYWGGACGIIGADSRRWRLHLPSVLRAAVFGAGDTSAYAFPDTGITMDFVSSPGGIVTATGVPGEPPFAAPGGIEVLPRYWEVHTDMAATVFETELTIAYDPTELPIGVPEEELAVWRYRIGFSDWERLETTIDSVNHTASVSGQVDLGLYLLGSSQIPEIDSLMLTNRRCVVPAASLISWWPGEGTATDVVGPNDGVFVAGTAGYGPGKVGAAFDFRGVEDWISIPDSPSLDLTEGLTIEAWMNRSPSPAEALVRILTKEDWVSGTGYWLGGVHSFNDDMDFRLNGQTGDSSIVSDPSPRFDQWVHYAATFDGTTAKLYEDGSLVGSSTPPFSTIVTNNEDANIGGSVDGRLDEVAIYGDVLQVEEIASIVAAGAAGKCTEEDVETSTEITWLRIQGLTYDIVGGQLAELHSDGGIGFATCLANNLESDRWRDTRANPSPGQGYYYLVRAESQCCSSSYGTASNGTDRIPFVDCP